MRLPAEAGSSPISLTGEYEVINVKKVYKLRKNVRVQAVRGKMPAPCNERTRKKKSFSLRVICAANYPHRIVKLEDLQLDILHGHLYSDMTPQNIFTGEFLVTEGYEEQFRAIAKEHGFCASEVMSCD